MYHQIFPTELFLPVYKPMSQSKNKNAYDPTFPSSYCFPLKKNLCKSCLCSLSPLLLPFCLELTSVRLLLQSLHWLMTNDCILPNSMTKSHTSSYSTCQQHGAHLFTPSILKYFLYLTSKTLFSLDSST